MALSPFGDDNELAHVMWLLRGWAIGDRVSPLVELERRLREILLNPSTHEYPVTHSDIESASDCLHLRTSGARLSNFQEACLDALSQVLFATEPATWDESRLNDMERILARIHGMAGDDDRFKLDVRAKKQQAVGRKVAKGLAEATDKIVWPLAIDLARTKGPREITNIIHIRTGIPRRTVSASRARLKKRSGRP